LGYKTLKIYPSQTKILDGRTNVSECDFEALFKGLSTRFGLRIVEKCFENAFGNVGSTVQNLRLGSIKLLRKRFLKCLFGLPKSSFGEHKVVTKEHSIPENQHITCHLLYHLATFTPPKRRFWKVEQTFCRPFRVRFRRTLQGCEYRIWATKTLKSASKAHSESLCMLHKRRCWKDEQKDEMRIFDRAFNDS